jgi:hypothetical protein
VQPGVVGQCGGLARLPGRVAAVDPGEDGVDREADPVQAGRREDLPGPVANGIVRRAERAERGLAGPDHRLVGRDHVGDRVRPRPGEDAVLLAPELDVATHVEAQQHAAARIGHRPADPQDLRGAPGPAALVPARAHDLQHSGAGPGEFLQQADHQGPVLHRYGHRGLQQRAGGHPEPVDAGGLQGGDDAVEVLPPYPGRAGRGVPAGGDPAAAGPDPHRRGVRGGAHQRQPRRRGQVHDPAGHPEALLRRDVGQDPALDRAQDAHPDSPGRQSQDPPQGHAVSPSADVRRGRSVSRPVPRASTA